MIKISPIGFIGSKYQLKKDNEIQPVTKTSNDNRSNNSDSNESSFDEILELEIQKQKKKKILKEE